MAHLACFLGHAQLLLREGEAAVGKVAGRHGDAGGGAGLAQHRARADRRELELIETLFLGKVIAQNLETGRNRHSRQNPNIERKVASTSAATGCDSKPTAPPPPTTHMHTHSKGRESGQHPHTCITTAAADCPSRIVSFPDVSANSPKEGGTICQDTVTSPEIAGPRTRLQQGKMYISMHFH